MVIVATGLRIAATFLTDGETLLILSAVSWAAAFLGYAALFGRMLVRPRMTIR
jgi:uncharacterized protein involved in response to NO